MSARDAILDAYESLVIEEGGRAATLDAVAARAGVSKGGLLYHFRSKEALLEAQIARLHELSDADRDAMLAAPDGPSRYYVRTSVVTGSALDRSVIAVAAFAQEAHPLARAAMAETRDRWFAPILDEVGDPTIATAILLLGDGLYFNAALSGDLVASGEATTDRSSPIGDAQQLISVVDRLLGEAGATP